MKTAIATFDHEPFDINKMPIWSLAKIRRIMQIGTITHVNILDAGTPYAECEVYVTIPNEGNYLGMVYKRDLNDDGMPMLSYLDW